MRFSRFVLPDAWVADSPRSAPQLITAPRPRVASVTGECLQVRAFLREYCATHVGEYPAHMYVPPDLSARVGSARVWCELADGRQFYGVAMLESCGQDDYFWDLLVCWDAPGCAGRMDARLCSGACGGRSPNA